MIPLTVNITKADAVKWAQTAEGLGSAARLAIVMGIAAISESDFVKYRDTLAEIIAALLETERGRNVLKEIGLDAITGPDRNANAKAGGCDCGK